MALLFDDKLDPRRLRYFMQVVECGSVRGAAEALDMDASAVSRAIAQLEAECGATLLARHGRGIVVTEAGELLAVFTRRQQSQKHLLLGQFDKIQKMALGHVDLVGGEGFVEWLTRNSLRHFMMDHPGITVDLDVASTQDIVRRIVDGIHTSAWCSGHRAMNVCACTAPARCRSWHWCGKAIPWSASGGHCVWQI